MLAEVRTAILVVIAALVLVTPRDSMAHPVDDRTLRSDSAIVVHTDRIASRIERGAVIVDVPVTYPDSSIVVGATTTWRLQLRDGSTVDLLPRNPRVRRTAKLLEPSQNFALWGRGPVARTIEFRHPLDSAMLSRVTGNLSSVTLTLQTDRLLMRRIASFSTRSGGTFAHQGARLHMSAVVDSQFALSFSYVRLPEGTDGLPWTLSFASVPLLAVIPSDGSAALPLTATRPDNDSGMRSPYWVLPGNEMAGYAGTLIPARARTVAGDGTVVAIAGDFAGRVARSIQAPHTP
jgi:hypothetical protein